MGRASVEEKALMQLLAEMLTETREAVGLSMSELATEALCSVASVSKIEQGRTAPGCVLLMRIAEALGVEADELLPTHSTVRARIRMIAAHGAGRDPGRCFTVDAGRVDG